MSGLRGRLRREARGDRHSQDDSDGSAAGVDSDPAEAKGGSDVVLYRCPTPTNYLCPCGAVERRLRRLGIDHRTERVPYKRKQRPEIAELTGQQRVPMLIDGSEVVYDSKRILEYLQWRFDGGGDTAG